LVSLGKSGAAHVGRGAASEDNVAGATASDVTTRWLPSINAL
jgi:hypothetical protein